MRSQDLKLTSIFHPYSILRSPNCWLELSSNVKCSTDLTTFSTLDSVLYVP